VGWYILVADVGDVGVVVDDVAGGSRGDCLHNILIIVEPSVLPPIIVQ
jgi:hypothetical protein